MSKICPVCFHHCRLSDGQTGMCFARKNKAGVIVDANYGKVTSLALDPIEKKPLYHFYPGSLVVSVGSYGCNLKCPFCQNVEISLADDQELALSVTEMMPQELVEICVANQSRGNIGLAFTYNEPLVGYEFVRDTAKLIHEKNMKNVVVTNGSVSPEVLDEVLPYIDAMNIDLKCFREDYYARTLKGDFSATKAFIRRAVRSCHVELTTLIIPEENDAEEEMRELAMWVAGIGAEAGKEIPLHISRFFPRSSYSDRTPTEVKRIYELAKIAGNYLNHVYPGNC